MDQIKIGKFIAALRKDKGLTQEQLGEKLGVTNKTISRWENGNYMPDVEMLSLLSKEFGVSINELISGERLWAEDFKKAADDNLVHPAQDSRTHRKLAADRRNRNVKGTGHERGDKRCGRYNQQYSFFIDQNGQNPLAINFFNSE